MKNNPTPSPNVSTEDFFNHFKHLFSEGFSFNRNDIENDLLNYNLSNCDVLDSEFSNDEVIKAISMLKSGKSGGFRSSCARNVHNLS